MAFNPLSLITDEALETANIGNENVSVVEVKGIPPEISLRDVQTSLTRSFGKFALGVSVDLRELSDARPGIPQQCKIVFSIEVDRMSAETAIQGVLERQAAAKGIVLDRRDIGMTFGGNN